VTPARAQPIAGAILAGGAGRRMGGGKPFRSLMGRPLLERVIERFRPQVGGLWLSARGNEEALRPFGVAIAADRHPERGGGALAGIITAIETAIEAGYDCVATVPCDAPFLPTDLVARLEERLVVSGAPAVVVRAGGTLHPTIALWRPKALAPLRSAFEADRRKLTQICDQMPANTLDAEAAGWPPQSFFNINTPDDLALASRMARSLVSDA
jgi:molybdenum cofactor guanylyltransferase